MSKVELKDINEVGQKITKNGRKTNYRYYSFRWNGLYDFPTNSPTNYPTNNHISWIWMRKKIGLKSIIRKERVGYRHHRFEYQVAIVML